MWKLFQLIEKFEHIQTFQLIENKNEWCLAQNEERGRNTENIQQIPINKLKNVMFYLVLVHVSINCVIQLIDFSEMDNLIPAQYHQSLHYSFN